MLPRRGVAKDCFDFYVALATVWVRLYILESWEALEGIESVLFGYQPKKVIRANLNIQLRIKLPSNTISNFRDKK